MLWANTQLHAIDGHLRRCLGDGLGWLEDPERSVGRLFAEPRAYVAPLPAR
jgi:hypothetical protein